MPPAAVQRSSAGTYVFVVDGQSKVVNRKVTLGQATEHQVIVTSGLSPGDRVVVDGADRVRDGQVVEAVTRPDDSAGQPAEPLGRSGETVSRPRATVGRPGAT